jgi:acetyl-CoA synthetase
MSEKNIVETSAAEIAVHWQEEDYYHPSPAFINQANLVDETLAERFSLDNFPDYYTEFAELLTWYKYWDEVLDTSDAPCFKWFKGGKLNASYNCIDRHLAKNKNKTAIHFVPELEDRAG